MDEALKLFIENQSPHLQPVFRQTHQYILRILPEMEVGLKWKTPFYTWNGPICYLQPSTNQQAVDCSFPKGKWIPAFPGSNWRQGNRKYARSIHLDPQLDFPYEALKYYLQEAHALNAAQPGWGYTEKSKK